MFFYKQKTAYEMRISDWSSDVCSSDLAGIAGCADLVECRFASDCQPGDRCWPCLRRSGRALPWRGSSASSHQCREERFSRPHVRGLRDGLAKIFPRRSEEHTSELQSLMRISYAVFCLKQKRKPHTPRKQA